MKIRESGMPEETYWESFFDSQFIFTRLEFDNTIKDAVEFGSGYGTFTIPATKIITGKMHAFDIDEEMISRLSQRMKEKNLSNLKIYKTDFVKEGTGLPNKSVNYVMLFNILHAEDPVSLLKEANRILKHDGKVGIIHWIHSVETPRGPSMKIRPKPEKCITWMESANFQIKSHIISLPPYHYGIVGIKNKNS